MKEIETASELLFQVGGARSLAKLLNVSTNCPAVWLNRGHIPAKYADCIRDAVQLPISGKVFNMHEVSRER